MAHRGGGKRARRPEACARHPRTALAHARRVREGKRRGERSFRAFAGTQVDGGIDEWTTSAVGNSGLLNFPPLSYGRAHVSQTIRPSPRALTDFIVLSHHLSALPPDLLPAGSSFIIPSADIIHRNHLSLARLALPPEHLSCSRRPSDELLPHPVHPGHSQREATTFKPPHGWLIGKVCTSQDQHKLRKC